MLEIFERWDYLFLLHLHQGVSYNRLLQLHYHIASQGHCKGCHEEVNPWRKVVWLIDPATARAEWLQYAERNYSATLKTFRAAERLQGNLQGRLGFLYSPLRDDISHEAHQVGSTTGQQPCTGSSHDRWRAGESGVSSDMQSTAGSHSLDIHFWGKH